MTSYEEFFLQYINYFKDKNIPKDLDGFSRELLLQEAYHDIYGIVDLDFKDYPVPLVAYTNADTLGDLGSVGRHIAEFRNNDIVNKFGLSINEYLNLPVDKAAMVLSRAQVDKEIEELASQMANEQAKQMLNTKKIRED